MRKHLLLVGILSASLLVRLFSVGWNNYLHGDVGMDASATASMVAYGKLLVFEERTVEALPDAAPLPPAEEGKILAQHGPLWPLLGSIVLAVESVEPTITEAYYALQLMSFLSGALMLVLSWLFARRLVGERDAIWIVAILGASYLMIDYGANGSFYMLQAALYLAWLLAAETWSGARKAVGLGAIGGLAYLLNFQSIVLLPAGMLVAALDMHPLSLALSHDRIAARIAFCLSCGMAFVLAASPWLIRNALVFGDPLQSHAINSGYVFIKAGMADILGPDGAVHPSLSDYGRLAAAMIGWLPNNLYYIARKLFVLLPVAFLLFPFAAIDAVFRPSFLQRHLPLIVILAVHLLISAIWPVPKFRYFVPMLPLVLLFVAAYVDHLRLTVRSRNLFYGASLVCTVVLSVLALRSTPSHTSYYDGAITTDPFSAHGELQFLRDQHLVP